MPIEPAGIERFTETATRALGDRAKAERWLRRPCRALGGARPIDLLVDADGAARVEAELVRIEHGVYD